ncbi:GntR family transcriptional regulator [Humitalea sp. 24SJ18S-53]|uniref:GntR family transcriptional regulator n=1 Tax=Humitalea sp. 24SJ18S-53 TaxID=3422307 RepID=UPI003D665E3F
MTKRASLLPATLPRHLADQLALDIERGEFPPGTRLSEAAIALRFGTSRGPVREALALLARDELVELRPRHGAFILALSADQLDEMFELRGALYALAVRLFTSRATQEQLAECTRHTEAVLKLAENPAALPQDFARANQAKSLFIVSHAGNQRLLDTMGRMTRQAFQHYAALAHLTTERRRETASSGARMLEQMKQRDAAAASAIAWHIVEASHAAVRSALGTRPTAAEKAPD